MKPNKGEATFGQEQVFRNLAGSTVLESGSESRLASSPVSFNKEHPVNAPRRVSSLASTIGLAFMGMLFAIPLLWMILAAFNPHATYSMQWPHWSLANFGAAYQIDHFHSFLNSLFLSVVATISGTLVSVLGGYALSRTHVPAKNIILVGILFLTGIPMTILIIPVYELFSRLNWLNLLPTALFLGATSVPFQVWIIKNAIDGVPRELDEAAIMERASLMRVLREVVFPVASPGIGAAAILGFVSAWGNFLIPFILLPNANLQPAPVEIYNTVSAVGIQYGVTAAYALLYAIPIVVLYAILARLFRGGSVNAGAIQGL